MPSYAAAIAYHTIISLAPLLLFSISIASFALTVLLVGAEFTYLFAERYSSLAVADGNQSTNSD